MNNNINLPKICDINMIEDVGEDGGATVRGKSSATIWQEV